jgi:tetratricopeptide (TPR) repeat protein
LHIENSSLTLHSALASMESGRYAAAVEDLSILISNRVHLDVAYLQRGLCLRALQQYEAAITDLEIALTQSHENKPDLYAGIADMWECLGDSARAIACYQTAIDASHHHAAAHFNLARLYIADAQYDGAARHFQYAFELDPLLLNAEMEFRLAQTLLKLGQFSKGWLGMEARWGMEAFLKTVTIPLGEPLKFDVSTLQDKSVLLWQDQGMGDTLQFCRYAPLIADLGARVFLNAPSALVPLLRNLDQRVQVLHQGMPLRRTDYQCSVSSLPLILKTDSVSKIPAQVPYLFSHPLKRNEWLVRLDQGASSVQKFRVGLAWAGGDRPNLIEQVEMNERRNLPIEKLTQLAHQQIDFISLQKGEVAEFELKSLMQQDSS